MRAYGFQQFGKPEDTIHEVQIPKPTELKPRDILVQNKAISVNPVDVKRMKGGNYTKSVQEAPTIVGNDSAGVVVAVGTDVQNYKEGDHVYFAGAIIRPGTFAEFTVVDERIVGKKPKSLGWAEAGGMPLVVLTAFEGLFEQLQIPEGKDTKGAILVVNGAGGVGSVVIQAVKKLTGLTVIATASRSETVDFCKKLGADHVINHREPLLPQIQELKLPGGLVDYVFNAHTTEDYFNIIPELLNPLGKVVFVTGTSSPLNAGAYMPKRQTITWEFMFSRSSFQYGLEEQAKILNRYADLVDSGELVHTVTTVFKIEEIVQALTLLESGKAIGKIALTW